MRTMWRAEEQRKSRATQQPEMLNCHLSAIPSCHQTPDELTRTPNPSRDESVLWWKHRDVDFLFNLYLFRESLLNSQPVFKHRITQPQAQSSCFSNCSASLELLGVTCPAHLAVTVLNEVRAVVIRSWSRCHSSSGAGALPGTNHMGRLYCLGATVLHWCS